MPEREQLDPTIADQLRQVSTATITSQLLKRGFRNAFMTGLVPLDPALRLVGTAFTLRYVPMREDLDTPESLGNPEHPQRKGIEMIEPGEVFVIDARGDLRAGTIGNILVTRIRQRGGAGVVSDGCFRDAAGIRAVGLPCYSRGAHASANVTIHHAADIQVPIGCGGVLVMPGDVLMGDGDGVVVIPRHLAAEVARDALEQERVEEFVLRKIQAGASIRGVYPPNADTLAEYRQQQGRP